MQASTKTQSAQIGRKAKAAAKPGAKAAAITRAAKKHAIGLGAWAAHIDPKNQTLAEYRSRVEADLQKYLAKKGEGALLRFVMAGFDAAIEAQEAVGRRRTVPPKAQPGTYPDDVVLRAVEFGAKRARMLRNRGNAQSQRARFEHELLSDYCVLTPDLAGWCLAGFDEELSSPQSDNIDYVKLYGQVGLSLDAPEAGRLH